MSDLLKEMTRQFQEEAGDDDDITLDEKYALRKKYGLSDMTDSDMEWYLSLDAQEARIGRP